MKKNNYFYIAIIGMSSIIGGAINYIYHPLILRFMSIEDFGIFGSLVGIFNILGVLTTGILLFLNKEFSKNLENKQELKSLFLDSTKILGILGGIIFLVYALSSPLIADFLQIDSYFLVILTGVSVIFSFLSISVTALLRSTKSFESISLSQILGPIVKLGVGILLVFLSFNIYGAIIGFLVSGIFSLIFLFYFALISVKNEIYISNIKGLLHNFFENKKEIIHFFLVSFFFALFMNGDVIIVRNLFSAEEAGIYAGIAVLGKFLIFLLLSIETVYFGQIMEYKKDKLPMHLVKNPIIITGVAFMGAMVFNFFFGKYILQLLKPELVESQDVYLLVLVYYGFLAFISFFIKILVGWGKYFVNIFLGILTLVLLICIYTFGSLSLYNFSLGFAVFGGITSIVLGIYFYITVNKH